MSDFRVRPGKPVARELARIMEAQLGRARARLDDWPADPESAFHEARRRLKKVRATARVARQIDEALAHAINACARDAGRVLSGARDADVVRAAAVKLAKSVEDDDAADALESFARHAATVAPANNHRGALAGRARGILDHTEALVRRLRDAKAPRKALARAATRALRRADRYFLAAHNGAGARGGENAEDLRHEWRKRVKDLWYVERLLRDVWPLERRPDDQMTNELGKVLGEERDLLLLCGQLRRAARPGGGAAPRDSALQSASAERARLIAVARRYGRKVHGLEPEGAQPDP